MKKEEKRKEKRKMNASIESTHPTKVMKVKLMQHIPQVGDK